MSFTMLVIEDNQDIRAFTALLLEHAGYIVLQAEDGKSGLELLAQTPVDLVLLDVCIPGMDGWEVCRRIKQHRDTGHIPVVFLTARDSPLDRIVGLEVMHGDGYLTKPFDAQALLGEVTRLLPCSSVNAQNTTQFME